jgi:hypothetical protein
MKGRKKAGGRLNASVSAKRAAPIAIGIAECGDALGVGVPPHAKINFEARSPRLQLWWVFCSSELRPTVGEP